MNYPKKIDLHMHTSISDGTDTPQALLAHVKKAGIELFSLTDHDAFKGCQMLCRLLKNGDPAFVFGIEFSCKDEEGKYHILGYGYDPEAASIRSLVHIGHGYRLKKLQARLDFLRKNHHITFPEEEVAKLFSLDNPGKPHLGNLMVNYGFAKTKEEAIERYINQRHFHMEYIRPQEAIQSILDGGGIPILAHPSYGNGSQIIVGEEMHRRLKRLMGYGLKGVEAYYSGFTKKLQDEILSFANLYELYVTAGSDYHGSNKLIMLGDTNLAQETTYPRGLLKFLEDVKKW